MERSDYLSLLNRAILNIDQNTPEARSKIYDRARHALLNQLEIMEPPLSEFRDRQATAPARGRNSTARAAAKNRASVYRQRTVPDPAIEVGHIAGGLLRALRRRDH
jgi:hypothetical protein